MRQELHTLKKVSHPNCTIIKEFYEDKKDIFIVMELIEGGTLTDFIINNEGLNQTAGRHILKQLVLALKYLHDSI